MGKSVFCALVHQHVSSVLILLGGIMIGYSLRGLDWFFYEDDLSLQASLINVVDHRQRERNNNGWHQIDVFY